MNAEQEEKLDRQSRQIIELNTRLEEQREKTNAQREKAAESELKLEELRKNQQPRRLDERFGKALQNKPSAKAEILYQPEDGEACNFAWNIFLALYGKWEVSLPRPISPDDATKMWRDNPSKARGMFPSTSRVGAQPTGLSIVVKNLGDPIKDQDTLFNILSTAFLDSGFGVGGGVDEGLPDGFVRVVVGQKP